MPVVFEMLGEGDKEAAVDAGVDDGDEDRCLDKVVFGDSLY
jgi:hypothetical protein